jgi:gluconate 2-dehydrogenase gamma chain
MGARRTITGFPQAAWLDDWRERVLSRRRFLLSAAGGSVAVLFPLAVIGASTGAASLDDASRWQLIGAVQSHLFPSEPTAPGAREINALAYLRSVVRDSSLEAEHRSFVLRGADWVAEQALTLEQTSFVELDEAQREHVLRQVAATGPGENWLSTLLTYLFEALLTDPVYGGNPEGIGWKWLGHTPGFPRPSPDKRYWML